MKIQRRITFADVKAGDTILLECDKDGKKGLNVPRARELHVCVRFAQPQEVTLVFSGLMDQFVFWPGNTCKRVEEYICSSCQSPDRPADLICTKPVWRYVLCRTSDLKQGDRTCRIGETAPKPRAACFVEEIQACGQQFHDGQWVKELFQITLRISRVGKVDRTKTIFRLPHSQLRRAQEVACGAVICDCCAQDPGDDKSRWCPDHWSIRSLEMAS